MEKLPAPVSYDRESFNILYGTQLEGHDDFLTAAQAGLINDRFDLQIHAGAHGHGDGRHLPEHFRLPMLQEQYDAAARVVDGLQPGDTLFIEGFGFMLDETEQFGDTSFLDDIDARAGGPVSDIVVSLAKSAFADMIRAAGERRRQAMAVRLEQERQAGSISAWAYARGLAVVKGVRVLCADVDAVEYGAITALGYDYTKPPADPAIDGSGASLRARVDSRRERAACNIIKDFALQELARSQGSEPGGRKPKLALLFGALHGEQLRRRFADMGLDAGLNIMDMQGTAVQLFSVVMQEITKSVVSIPVEPEAERGGEDRRSGGAFERLRRFRGKPGAAGRSGTSRFSRRNQVAFRQYDRGNDG